MYLIPRQKRLPGWRRRQKRWRQPAVQNQLRIFNQLGNPYHETTREFTEFSQQQLGICSIKPVDFRIKHFRFEYWDFSPIKIATWVIHRCLKWLVTILRSSSIVYRWMIDVYSYSKPWTYPEAAKRRAQAFQKWCQRKASVRVRVPRVPLGIPWTSAVSCVRWRLEWWYDVNKIWKLGNSNFLQVWKSFQHLGHWARSWSLSPHAEYGHGKLRTNSSFWLWNPTYSENL